MRFINPKKNNKFTIGALVALMASCSVATLSLFDFIISILVDISLLFRGSFLIFFGNFVQNYFSFTAGSLSAFALWFFGAFLFLKQRKRILLVFPVIGASAVFINLNLALLNLIFGTRPIENTIYALGWLTIIVAYALFFVFILLTCKKDDGKPNIWAWTSCATIALGYTILTLCGIIGNTVYFISQAINYNLLHWRILIDIEPFVNSVSIFTYPIVLFIAATWIANPYKKISLGPDTVLVTTAEEIE